MNLDWQQFSALEKNLQDMYTLVKQIAEDNGFSFDESYYNNPDWYDSNC